MPHLGKSGQVNKPDGGKGVTGPKLESIPGKLLIKLHVCLSEVTFRNPLLMEKN